MNTEKIIFNKRHLKENLDKLSESDIQEILDFAGFILTKRYKRKKFPQERKLDPQRVRSMVVVGSKKMVVYDDTADNKIAIFDKDIDRMAVLGENWNAITMSQFLKGYSDKDAIYDNL